MDSNYRCICLDLDNTLLNSDGKVSQENVDAIRACLMQGVQVYVVTGRPYFFARYIANIISKDVKVISSNGGCYELKNKIVERRISKEAMRRIIEILSHSNLHCFFKGKENIYTHESTNLQFTYDQFTKMKDFPFHQSFCNMEWIDILNNSEDVIKILAYNFDHKILQDVKEKIMKIPNIEVSGYSDISFDINSKNTTKGNAIQNICTSLGIHSNEIIAFGDGENDISMFQICGYNVAMENSIQKIKDICDEVTLSADESGVAFILNRIFNTKI